VSEGVGAVEDSDGERADPVRRGVDLGVRAALLGEAIVHVVGGI